MSKSTRISKGKMVRIMAKNANEDVSKIKRTWLSLRYKVLSKNDGRCELCGRSKHDGVKLTVDHKKSRRNFPLLALDEDNLQVLCSDCNVGKGSFYNDDWTEIMDWESDPHTAIRQMDLWWRRCEDGHKAQFIKKIGGRMFSSAVMKQTWDNMTDHNKQKFIDLIVDELDV